jgi:hypothetical protein
MCGSQRKKKPEEEMPLKNSICIHNVQKKFINHENAIQLFIAFINFQIFGIKY